MVTIMTRRCSDGVDKAVEEIHRQGYTVLYNFLSTDQLAATRKFLTRRTGAYSGRNNFEGARTERIYALLSQDRIFQDIVEDPRIMAICDNFLEANYLLTTSQAICIHPGETPQPWHCDDAFYSIPRPRTVAMSTIIAIDDFCLANGCTEVVPGSNLWSDEQVGGDYRDGENESDPNFAQRVSGQSIPVEMPAGACVVFAGNTLHRGGRNTSDGVRRALSNQYCQPWARTIENFYLTIPREQVKQMSPKIQSLLGYSVHPPFMGQVSGSHPIKTLDPDFVPSIYRNP
jgi:ectoine hydroxylase-related dioxygenase (phytanoyl-CoA dioxygenase family)